MNKAFDRASAPRLGEIGLSNFVPYLMNRIMGRYNADLREQTAAIGLTTPKMRTLAVLSVIDGLLILMAGAVLLTPGLLTDAVGFLLLVPPVRELVRRALGKRLEARFMGVPPGRQRPPASRRSGRSPGATGSAAGFPRGAAPR